MQFKALDTLKMLINTQIGIENVLLKKPSDLSGIEHIFINL